MDDAPSLTVAVCQLTSIDDVQSNLRQILDLLAQIESDVPDLICFPENALYMRLKEGEPLPGLSINDPAILSLASWAKAKGSYLHLGSVPLLQEGRLFNASLLLTPEGSVLDLYNKIHLFDVDVKGQKPIRESEVFSHGEGPAVFTVKGWRFGSSICYDLRFSELYLHYAKFEVDAILVPAAFLVPTGQAHWKVLLRARAIECQAFVLAAAQGGEHRGANGDSRRTYGHSMIVDPWGVVLEESEEMEETKKAEKRILRATLTRDRIRQVRSQIPMKDHRRLK